MSTGMLDVIDKGEISESHPHPLLFVHGAWQAGWCWEDNFLDSFAARGFRVVAPSLRGHGSSPTSKPLWRCSVSDYADDLCSVIGTLSSSPVLVGHSLGGFVVQKYLERCGTAAAILIASTPPRGGQLHSLLRSIRRHPWRSAKFAFTGNPSDLCGTAAGVRELFFGSQASDSVVEAFARRMSSDSVRAMLYDTVIGDLVRTRQVRTPVLVLGGEADQVYTPDDVRRTAAAYDTEPIFLPGVGHEVMLEPGWQSAVDHIASWLASRGL